MTAEPHDGTRSPEKPGTSARLGVDAPLGAPSMGAEDAGLPATTAAGRRRAALVAGGILLSRIAGLARERALSHFLGVGPAVDAFRAASRIPNVLQNLLGEGVLSASFIPVYAAALARGDDEEAGRIAGAVAGLLAALAGTLVLVGVVFARPLTQLLAPGFTGARFELTVTLTRILTPGIGVLVLSAWCLGVLNSHRRFFLSYVAPVLWNAAQIVALVALGIRGVEGGDLAVGLAWGAFVGGFLQLAVQLPVVTSLVRPLRLSLRTELPGVREVLRRFGPVVAGRGVVQLSAYVDLLLASLLAVGAVSALGYAQIFYLLPVSLFGMSVAAAELPELSRAAANNTVGTGGTGRRLPGNTYGCPPPGKHATGKHATGMHATGKQRRRPSRGASDDGLARIAFFVLGSSIAYLVLGDLVVGALLQTGEFRAEDARLVWYVLGAFSVGLLATTASRLAQNALYALGDTKGPAVIAAVRVVTSAALRSGPHVPARPRRPPRPRRRRPRPSRRAPPRPWSPSPLRCAPTARCASAPSGWRRPRAPPPGWSSPLLRRRLARRGIRVKPGRRKRSPAWSGRGSPLRWWAPPCALPPPPPAP